MSDPISFKQKAYCTDCKHEFEMKFISSTGKAVDDIQPRNCPECGCTTFYSRFNINPANWIGFFGSNG